MHWLTRISIAKPWLTFLITAVLVGVTIFGTLQLEQEMIPDIDLPMSTVIALYPGATPEEVMDNVTVPVEEALAGTPGVTGLISTSSDNMCFVFVEFEYGTDMDKANAELSKKLSVAVLPSGMPSTMPGGEPNPQLFPLDMSMLPVTILSLKGDVGMSELKDIATTEIIPALSGVEGVFSVSLEGGEEKVMIDPEPAELNAKGITASQIVAALGTAKFDSIQEIENMLIGPSTALKDVAEVWVGPPPGTAILRTDGVNSIGISITKRPEANTVAVANEVEKKAGELASVLADRNAELITVFDQSDFIERSIADLRNEAVIGGALAIVIILLFLMTVRGSLVIAISIPLSLLIGFFVMRLWGLTLNILTLSAMAIAVGRIVDDSIVLLEVIYRRLREGQSFREAALGGSREVALPITTATLATVAIFLPLAFVGGIVGELFVPFALTVTFALIASLIVSLTIVPALSKFLVPKKIRAESNSSWYHRLYLPVLGWALGHRALTCLIAVVLFVGSLGLIPVIGTSFMPAMAEKMLTVDIELDLDTDMNTTSSVAESVEEIIKNNSDKVQVYHTTVGSSSSFVGAMTSLGGGGGTNRATIEVLLEPDAELQAETEALQSEIDKLGHGEAIKVNSMDSMMGDMDPSSFQVYVRGSDYAQVVAAAEQLVADIQDIEGLEDVATDVSVALPKPSVRIDQVSYAFHVTQGLDPALFQAEYAGLMQGMASQATCNANQVAISSLFQNAETAEDLGNLRLFGGLSYPIKLSEIANVEIAETPTSIRRIDQQRAVTVSAKVTAKDVGAVNIAVQEKLDAFSVPGVNLVMGGVAEEMEETFSSMGKAILIAIAIAFVLVMVSFRSVINTVLIMISLPLASIGALLGLLIAGHTVGASAMMGMLMLVGIVLTNAIVLISLVEQLRASGLDTRQALIEGGRTRLRPILMTALTTMIALVPMAMGFGEGVLLASELAVVVVGGLFTSTLLTLLVIPVLYSLVSRYKRPPKQASS